MRDVLALFERDDTSWDPDEDYDFTRELVDLLHDCKAHAAPAVPMYMRWIEQNKNTKRAIDALYHVGPKAAAAMPLLLPLLEPSEHTLSVIHALQGLGPKAAPAAKRLGEMVAGIRLPEKGNPRHDALEGGGDWVSLHRNVGQDTVENGVTTSVTGMSEQPMRNMFAAWKEYMTAENQGGA